MSNHVTREVRNHGSILFPCSYYHAKHMERGSYTFQVPYHWHDKVEIIHIEKGVFDFYLDSNRYTITEECFLFIRPGSIHQLLCLKDYEEHAIVFDPYMLSFESDDKIQRNIIRPMIDNSLSYPVILSGEHPIFKDVKKEYEEIQYEFQKSGECQGDQYNLSGTFPQLMVKTCILRIMGILYEKNLICSNYIEDAGKTDYMKKILLYIEDHYMDKIYLEDLASIANLNEQYFSRHFKAQFGQSPMKYLMDFRLRKAEKMLLETDLTITQVALECGFPNLGHFMKEFKNKTKCTPKEYKKIFL